MSGGRRHDVQSKALGKWFRCWHTLGFMSGATGSVTDEDRQDTWSLFDVWLDFFYRYLPRLKSDDAFVASFQKLCTSNMACSVSSRGSRISDPIVHKSGHNRHPLHEPSPESKTGPKAPSIPELSPLNPRPLIYIESNPWYIQFDTEWCLRVCCRSMEGVRNLPNAWRLYPNLPPYAMHIRLSS